MCFSSTLSWIYYCLVCLVCFWLSLHTEMGWNLLGNGKARTRNSLHSHLLILSPWGTEFSIKHDGDTDVQPKPLILLYSEKFVFSRCYGDAWNRTVKNMIFVFVISTITFIIYTLALSVLRTTELYQVKQLSICRELSKPFPICLWFTSRSCIRAQCIILYIFLNVACRKFVITYKAHTVFLFYGMM